jgi:hypothetical protein
MPTTRIKEKISKLVSGHVPEFIKSDYTTFVSFIEAYYRFLEQDQGALEVVQNAKEYGDIDRTLDSFVNYFIANYAQDIGYNALVNKRLLIKRIKDLYEAKGSDLSFKILFKLLYDTLVESSHPYDNVLIASDGTWDQRVSLRVELTSGSIDNITDRFLNITKNSIVYNDAIVRVRLLDADLYEVFLKSSSTTPYELGDVVSVSSTSGVIFTGIVKPTTVSTRIVSAGSGFKAGQIFNVPISGGINTLIRILTVNSTGGILSLRILNFGYNYPTENVTINLFSDLTVATRTEIFNTISGGFRESIQILSPHTVLSPSRYFFSDYIDNYEYTGNLLAIVSSDQSVTSATTSGNNLGSTAIITMVMGAVARYPGQFTTSQGFISEPEVRLQDDQLYQPFAYQLASDLDISVFYDTVKKLIHPTGTNLFNNRILSTTANLQSNISVITSSNIFIELRDTFEAIDVITLSNLYERFFFDNTIALSSNVYSLYRSIDNNDSIVSVTDTTVGVLSSYTNTYSDNTYFSQSGSDSYVADLTSTTVFSV